MFTNKSNISAKCLILIYWEVIDIRMLFHGQMWLGHRNLNIWIQFNLNLYRQRWHERFVICRAWVPHVYYDKWHYVTMKPFSKSIYFTFVRSSSHTFPEEDGVYLPWQHWSSRQQTLSWHYDLLQRGALCLWTQGVGVVSNFNFQSRNLVNWIFVFFLKGRDSILNTHYRATALCGQEEAEKLMDR